MIFLSNFKRLGSSLVRSQIILWFMFFYLMEISPNTPVYAKTVNKQNSAQIKTHSSSEFAKSADRKFYENFNYVMSQAHAIYRESMWIIAKKRAKSDFTIFGKLRRAFVQAHNGKLKDKIFTCDKYLIESDTSQISGRIYHNCTKQKELVSEWTRLGSNIYKFTFYSQYFQEIVGVSSAVLNFPVTCKLTLNEKFKLMSLHCENYHQDKTFNEIYSIEEYNYNYQENELIKISGHLLVDLVKNKKIDIKVPLKGKIHITETQIEPPMQEEKTKSGKSKIVPPGPIPPSTKQVPKTSPSSITQEQVKQSEWIDGGEHEFSGDTNTKQYMNEQENYNDQLKNDERNYMKPETNNLQEHKQQNSEQQNADMVEGEQNGYSR